MIVLNNIIAYLKQWIDDVKQCNNDCKVWIDDVKQCNNVCKV